MAHPKAGRPGEGAPVKYFAALLLAEGVEPQAVEDHEWRILPWSFPDFREKLYMEEFGAIRRIYKEQRRGV